MDEEVVRALDEHVSKIKGNWWQHLLQKNETFSHEEYYENLVKTVLSISRMGGVIVGRGANYILGEKRAFRIRIVGSVEKCAERVASRENIDIKSATELVNKVNSERTEYIKQLYDTDICDTASYDIILNSDRFIEPQMVELILDAMAKAGYKLPADAVKAP
jgi:cytidylate kinase